MSGRKRLVVHFNTLKLCPLNLWNYSKQSQCSDLHVAKLTPLHQLPCEQSACIPEDDEYNSELLPVTSHSKNCGSLQMFLGLHTPSVQSSVQSL